LKPFEHIYLMGPSGCLEGRQKGEYGLLSTGAAVTALIPRHNQTAVVAGQLNVQIAEQEYLVAGELG
jgi:hypothetical protein